jgi:hypothetical protein
VLWQNKIKKKFGEKICCPLQQFLEVHTGSAEEIYHTIPLPAFDFCEFNLNTDSSSTF